MDIDIDLGDRTKLLDLIDHVPASILRDNSYTKHNSGIYMQAMPLNPLNGLAAVDYQTADNLGFFKIDILNVHLYQQIQNEQHLEKLMNTVPVWELLNSKEFVDLVIHINGHYETLCKMEPIDSIEKMAMFLSVIRPGKRHLIGQSWDEVRTTVWDVPSDGSYHFKRSHSVAYAHLVVVHMNLLAEQANELS